MTVTSRLMKPGSWSLKFKSNCPRSIYSAPDFFDHIVITPTRLEPISSFTDANILANAVYTGVITRRPDPLSLQGAGLEYWMGSPDGTGMITSEPTANGGTHTLSYLLAGIPIAAVLVPGTVSDTGLGTLTDATIPAFTTFREILDGTCRYVGAEWRVNPNGTYDAALASSLFVTTPTVVVTRNADGQEGSYRGVNASSLNAASDVEQYTTKVYAVKNLTTQATSSFVSTYRNFAGDIVQIRRAVDASGSDGVLSEIASSTLSQFSSVRRELALSSATYTITRAIRPGDYVYVWDQEAGLADATVQIPYRGELISPVKLRVYALTWPLEQGMGVYLRHSTGTGTCTYTDLTDQIEWETGDVTWEVGAADRAVSNDTSNVGNISNLGQNGVIARSLIKWIDYSAVVAYGGNPAGCTVLTAAYADDGSGELDVEIEWSITGAIAAGDLSVTLPFAQRMTTNSIVGHYILNDVSTGGNYEFEAYAAASSATTNPGVRNANGVIPSFATNVVPFAIAVGDKGSLRAHYRRV